MTIFSGLDIVWVILLVVCTVGEGDLRSKSPKILHLLQGSFFGIFTILSALSSYAYCLSGVFGVRFWVCNVGVVVFATFATLSVRAACRYRSWFSKTVTFK